MDKETVDVGSINSFKGRLDKIKKQGWVFMDPAWSAKPRPHGDGTPVRPRKVSELQGELKSQFYRFQRQNRQVCESGHGKH